MVWVGLKVHTCLSVTNRNHTNCVSLLSALGAMATPTLSNDGEPATQPRLKAGRWAESLQGAQLWGKEWVCIDCLAETAAGTGVAGEKQTAGEGSPPG